MRRSLFSSLPILLLIACNGKADSGTSQIEGQVADSIGIALTDPDTNEITFTVTDEAIIDSGSENPNVNQASKELKESKADKSSPVAVPDVPGSGVREHGSPQKSALDSLKEAKSKGKK